MSLRAINMSLSEFYNIHNGFKTRIVLHIRDSKQTVVGAPASALYLIKKREVVAIMGPGSTSEINLKSHYFILSNKPYSRFPPQSIFHQCHIRRLITSSSH